MPTTEKRMKHTWPESKVTQIYRVIEVPHRGSLTDGALKTPHKLEAFKTRKILFNQFSGNHKTDHIFLTLTDFCWLWRQLSEDITGLSKYFLDVTLD